MSRYRFGEFTLDLVAFDLRRQGSTVRLERRPFDLLAILVQQPGRLVPREELIAALWPSNVVIDFDAGLNTLVRKVRAALGDSSEEPRFLETVPGRGYRFVAQVEIEAVAPPAVSTTASEGKPGAVPAGVDTVARDSVAPVADVTDAAATLPRRSDDADATGRDAAATARQAPPRRRAWLAAAAALLLLGIGGAAWLGRAPSSGYTRVAVLPFDTLAADDALGFLASGLAEDTSISLARIDPARLRVVAVASRPVDATAADLPELGRRLGVDLVVRSALQKDGTRIRLTSRLLRVKDGEQLWSEAFDRELTNVLGLQRELSTAIAEQIRLSLSPEVAAAIRRRQTENPAAYALYLEGRYEWKKLTPASVRRAIDLYSRATQLDPSYGLAWAEMAFAAATSLRAVDADPRVATPLARAALRRALELSPDLTETRYARGYVALFCDLRPRDAVVIGREAIRLDPNNSQAHMLLGIALGFTGQLTEAREMVRRSRELDPLFALAFANSAVLALSDGDPNAAVEYARQSIAIDPEFWVGYNHLGAARARLGDRAGAFEAYDAAARYSGGHSLTYRGRFGLLLSAGRTAEARALVADMLARNARGYFPAYTLAAVHARLGDQDAAYSWLERSVDLREMQLLGLPRDEAFAELRAQPRFAALIARCGCVAPTAPPAR